MPEISSTEYYPIGEKQPKTEATSFLKPILDKQLTVDEIDNYADVAIDGLVSLVNKKVRDYQFSHVTGDWDDKTVEDKALEFYGLQEVGSYLDFLSVKEREIKKIGKIINNRINHNNKVLVPPDKQNFSPIETGSGEGMEDKKIINRTKAILFILKEDFGVDIDNEQQLSLDDGVVKDNMMRKISYVLIKCPTIERSILVCDEEGNASYVLNDAILKNQNISNDSLVSLTKTELNALITENPQLGKRVIYSENGFVPRIIEAIKHPNSNIPDMVTAKMENTGKYLYPKATENEVSVSALAKSLGVGSGAVNNIIETIPAEELGKIEMRRCGQRIVGTFNLKQQEVITKYLEERKLLVPKAGENELSTKALVKSLGVDYVALYKALETIPTEVLGKIEIKRIGSNKVAVFNSEQQKIIIKHLEEANLLAPKASENELSCGGFAAKLKIGNDVLSKVIEKIPAEELGKIEMRRCGQRIVGTFNLKQQKIIIKHLEEANLLAPKATKNEISVRALAKLLGVCQKTFNNVIETIPTEELGPVVIRKFGPNTTNAYSSEQQAVIKKYIDQWKRQATRK